MYSSSLLILYQPNPIKLNLCAFQNSLHWICCVNTATKGYRGMTTKSGKSNYFWREDKVLIKSFLMIAPVLLKSNLEEESPVSW